MLAETAPLPPFPPTPPTPIQEASYSEIQEYAHPLFSSQKKHTVLLPEDIVHLTDFSTRVQIIRTFFFNYYERICNHDADILIASITLFDKMRSLMVKPQDKKVIQAYLELGEYAAQRLNILARACFLMAFKFYEDFATYEETYTKGGNEYKMRVNADYAISQEPYRYPYLSVPVQEVLDKIYAAEFLIFKCTECSPIQESKLHVLYMENKNHLSILLLLLMDHRYLEFTYDEISNALRLRMMQVFVTGSLKLDQCISWMTSLMDKMDAKNGGCRVDRLLSYDICRDVILERLIAEATQPSIVIHSSSDDETNEQSYYSDEDWSDMDGDCNMSIVS
jgi:hypothetical protein